MAIKGIDREALAKRIEQRKKEGDIKPKECEGNKDIVPKIQSKIIKNRFRVDENGVWEIKDGKNQKFISKYMEIKSIRKNIDTGKYSAILAYKSFFEIQEIEIDREVYLNKNKLLELINLGVDVRHDNVAKLVEYFRVYEEIIKKISNVHSELGFAKYNNKYIYKLYKAIGVESQYVGNYKIEPKGSKEEYKKMLREEVQGRCELEFVTATSLSALVLGYIGERVGVDSSIVHLVGNSTTGKSTALKLGISLFANPDSKVNGLFGTYNGTNNALLKKLNGLKGVPYALDEISMSYTQNFTNFVYGLANGTDKERLNKDSELKKKGVWLTTILSNGEKSLIGSSNKNAGVQIRVIEASNVTWTRDAENAEKINRVIQQNYGHIGFEFAEYIMKRKKDQLVKQFEISRDEIYKKMEDELVIDSMTFRRCNKFGIILQTAYLFQDMMDINLDIDGIKSLMVEIERESLRNRNFRDSAIDYIKQYVSKYINKFQFNNNSPNDIFGKLIPKQDCVEVQMNKISFEQMINQGGYEDKNVVLKELKDAGYLNCEKDRYTRSRKNSFGCSEEVYVIKLPKEETKEMIEEEVV